jgi:hypothetical protein
MPKASRVSDNVGSEAQQDGKEARHGLRNIPIFAAWGIGQRSIAWLLYNLVMTDRCSTYHPD